MNGRNPIALSGQPFRFAPDPKPARSPGGTGRPKKPSPKRASQARWVKIRERKMGACYVCRWLDVRQELPSTLHHVVSKSLGGSDTEGNVVPLCGSGTTGHHGLVEAHHAPTCQALAAAIQAWDDLVYRYAVGKLGEDGWLRRYKVQFRDVA